MSTFTTHRTFAASPADVYAAFQDPERLARWWGPAGFRNTFEVFEFRPGGRWVFDMIGPDGQVYPNEAVFARLEADRELVIEHVCAPFFTLTVTLVPTAEGTLLHFVQAFADPDVARAVAPIVVPANEQNLDRLGLTLRAHPIAQGLVQARRTGGTWPAHGALPEITPTEAYAIQAAVASQMGWFATGPRAWKVGGTTDISAAPLPEVLSAPATWTLPPGQDTVLIEAELAFRLARTPQPGDTPQALLACLGTVCVAIELIGTRLSPGLAAPSVWKLADQGVHAGLVSGEERPVARCVGRSLAEWATQACHIRVMGEPDADTARARGSHPAVSPLLTLPWLVQHAAAHTGGLQAGDLITAGAWLVRTVRRGDEVEVGFDGLGAVRLRLQ